MELYSTKHSVDNVSFEKAVFKGLPDDNGLYMPTEIPKLPQEFFDTIEAKSFPEIAFEVSNALIGDEIPAEDLKVIIDDAVNFEAPVVNIHDNINVLELFHGPSFAFKDFGARFMSRVMSYFLKKSEKEINILVATSGDTGSAVGHGFLGVDGIKVTILYPSGKVSNTQEKQLTTLGQNITALEVDGVFDDCQTLVKTAFLDSELTAQLNLSSANSINIARLIPQSFYYFWTYAQLKKQGKPVVFCVPSGNFGNICGGLIASKMGLPVEKFIAATNVNDIVPHYLTSGLFEPKSSIATISNAMDVGNPSNFPRMIALYGNDYDKVVSHIVGKTYNDDQTKEAMKAIYDKYGYVMCPHTAIAYLGLTEYMKESGSNANGVLLSTAHPAKFDTVVDPILGITIGLPEHLKEINAKEKVATPMKADFNAFKELLLS
ncbi:threonine synthase [Cyclobacteriaceae bacterium]|nr:threonine synthase [Cyclobacteriaceae bacterium]